MRKWTLVEFEALRDLLGVRPLTWGPKYYEVHRYDWVDDRMRFWRWQSRPARGRRIVRRTTQA